VALEPDKPKPAGNDQAPSETRTILLVDDVSDTRTFMKLFLGNFGYVVHPFASAEDALAVFDPRVHDVVVTDNAMPGMTGLEMAHVIKMRSPSTPILMYTASRPRDCSCLDLVIEKPAPLSALKNAIDEFLASR
jgi:CheY-like chemotaxis protein